MRPFPCQEGLESKGRVGTGFKYFAETRRFIHDDGTRIYKTISAAF